MAKVLIASIGAGGRDKDTHYAYRMAKYFRAGNPDGELCETPLIAAAIKKMYDIGQLILIGTSGSSWASFYEYIHSKDNTYIEVCAEYDMDYQLQLMEISDKSKDSKTRLSTDKMQKELLPLKAALGPFCRNICILEYGMTPDEQLKNLVILNKLAKSLENGDKIYFDISHSFRSLPFYELLTVNLAKNILQRNVTIEMVSYGMHEVSDDLDGNTPIVDMTQLIELMEWTRAVDEYNRVGKFDLLLELWKGKLVSVGSSKERQQDSAIGRRIDQQLSNKVRKAFTKLVEMMASDNYNQYDVHAVINQTIEALESQHEVLSHPVALIIHQIMAQVAEHFEPYKDDRIASILAFVLWKIKKGQNVIGALLLTDAAESMCMDVIGKDIEDDEARDKVHARLIRAKYVRHGDKYVNAFTDKWNAIRIIRNNLAHAGKPNVNDLSLNLSESTMQIISLYVKRFAPGKPERELLKDLFK